MSRTFSPTHFTLNACCVFLLFYMGLFVLYAGGNMKPINGWNSLEVDGLALLRLYV